MSEKPVVWVEPFKSWVAPLTRFNQFVVGQTEQWAALQMGSLKAYVDLGVAQMRARAAGGAGLSARAALPRPGGWPIRSARRVDLSILEF